MDNRNGDNQDLDAPALNEDDYDIVRNPQPPAPPPVYGSYLNNNYRVYSQVGNSSDCVPKCFAEKGSRVRDLFCKILNYLFLMQKISNIHHFFC